MPRRNRGQFDRKTKPVSRPDLGFYTHPYYGDKLGRGSRTMSKIRHGGNTISLDRLEQLLGESKKEKQRDGK